MNDEQYLQGGKNRAIRYYFYLSNGLTILNEFRNLFLGIFALYFALKLDNILWLVVMFIPCILILTATGYYNVHHISKIKEWLNLKFGTHYGIQTFDYTIGTYELLQEINKKLDASR